jgi:hypothetical protein
MTHVNTLYIRILWRLMLNFYKDGNMLHFIIK